MQRTSMTMPSATIDHRRTLTAALAGLCVAVGPALALALSAWWPLALSAAAAIPLAWLLHTAPLVQYVEYFSADEDGLRFVHPGQDGRGGRILHYKWTEIRAVSALPAAAGGPGLLLHTGRGAASGTEVLLPMPSDCACQTASTAVQDWLSAYRV